MALDLFKKTQKIGLMNTDLYFSFGLISIIFMMFVPLPPFLLDFLLSISITIGFLSLLVAIYIKEPLDFSTFPTFLLLATLFRLALNIATTRNILLEGASGNVSNIVSSFGEFVVGGNYFVGFVIFLILVIVNFLVITKGAGRVAEVGARFTLDAMPGKQMAIDADLNSGLIDRDEAKKRRKKIEQEADFYGSMDGASKFVRGDAIAGLIVTAINIVVGLIVGVWQHDMRFSEAAEIYTLLTVGDGLVSQIPSIIVSVSAGIVVTRASSGQDLSKDISGQMLLNSKALYICSSLLFVLSVTPGLSNPSFFILSILFFFTARWATKEKLKQASFKNKFEKDKLKSLESPKDSIQRMLYVEPLTLEVGSGLIPLVDKEQDGEILERIVVSRKQFAQDMGVVIPMVMVRDNLQLKSGEYQILLRGNCITWGSLHPGQEMAMSSDIKAEPLAGIKAKEPAYGLDAYWIKNTQKDEAVFKGYTVVNCATIIVTHLTKVIHDHAWELIGRQEVHNLVDKLKEKNSKVVEEVLSAEGVKLGCVVKVLQNLLKEGINIRDLLSIFETLADYSREIKNPDILTRYVRRSLGRVIINKYIGREEELNVAVLDRQVEDIIFSGIQRSENGTTSLNLEPQFAQKLLNNIAESLKKFNELAVTPVLVCGGGVRWDLKKMIDRFVPGIVVLAFDEIPTETKTTHIVTVTA